MKKIGLLLSVLMIFGLMVKAQPGGGMMDPAEMVKRNVDQINQTCTLTKEQLPKVEAIVKKYSDKTMEMFQGMQGGGGGDFSAMREKMTKLQDDQTKELKAVLTAEQSAKYDKFLQERRERMRQMGGPGGQGGPGM
jgi:Spy/CpxP family protein refolding chaperone